MGLLDRLRTLIDRDRDGGEPSADPEDLLALTDAALTLEAELGYGSAGEAALCFAPSEGTEFETTLDDLAAVLDASGADSGLDSRFRDDGHGYRWLVLAADGIEDLATGLQFAAAEFVGGGFEDDLLAAVAAFHRDDSRAYLLYSFERGRYYPFVPTEGRERDAKTELSMEATLEGEIPLEADRSEWYPLWPSSGGADPWE